MARFDEAFNRLDQCLKDRMAAFHTPALTLALTDRSRTVRLSAYGFANLDTRTPVQTDHLFAIGSVGKAFTGIAALQACEAGLLDLHAPVQTYLPWFEIKSNYAPITVHHLLTHSAGLPRGMDFSPDPRGEIFALRDQTVGFAPGAHFSYSDLGYKVAGLVLQAVTGKRYADLIREKILEPLEMHSTYAVTTSALRSRMAAGYRDLYDDRPSHVQHPLVPADWVETDSADGCIVSSAEDMAKFARMLLNHGAGPRGRLLSLSGFQKMIEPMIAEEGDAYSYGLHLFQDEGYRMAGHGGDVPGYEAYLWLDLDNNLGSVVLMTEPYTPRASFLALEYFRAAYLGQQLPDPPPMPDFTHVIHPQDYAGQFQSETCTLTLTAEGHHLLLNGENQRVILEQRSMDCFYINHPNWDRFLLRFERLADGSVGGVSYGPLWFTRAGLPAPEAVATPPEWAAYPGHYRAHNPWASNFRVFIRQGQLFLAEPTGEEEVLIPLEGGCFRIGEDDYIPERLCFEQIVEGQALRVVRSGGTYYRFFTP